MNYIYAKAANGMTVRIPADKYEKWKKTQDEMKQGKRPAEARQTEKSLRSFWDSL